MKRIKLMGGCALVGLLCTVSSSALAVTLGISADGRFFTIEGVPTYLNGVSYYGAQSITTASYVTSDLNDMVADGFNWIRVWGHWATPNGEDVSVLTDNGTVREPYMTRLKTLITECNARGIIVDVSLNRDANNTWVGATTLAQHLACVQTLANHLLPYRNVYIDISNERDVMDGRYVSLSECGQLINAIKAIDPSRLCTASSTPTSQSDLAAYRNTGKMDFICPHLCRDSGCAAQTIGKVNEFNTWMTNLGWRIPIHLQEPFRRGYTTYNPVEDDFLRDCNGGKLAGAAGWCLHNGSNANDTPPHRSFQMTNSDGRLYAQWDSVETNVTNWVSPHISGNDLKKLRYQPEYDEQLSKQIGRRDGSTRSANVAQDAAGYLTFGPYITRLPADTYQATWRMAIDNVTANNEAVVTIDVYTIDTNTVLATRTITRQEFAQANVFQDFTLNFTYSTPGNRLEWRTNWFDNSYLKVDYIEVSAQQTPIAPVICEVSPDPDMATVGGEYTKQLNLCVGYPAPTWSVVSGPSGVQVSSTGYVYGWTPTSGQAGQTLTITIRATNSQGHDDESWQVTVQSVLAPFFEDTLINNSKISGSYGSGTFSAAGYTLSHSGGYDQYNTTEPRSIDFVWYDKTGTWTTGSIEFDVSGLYPSSGCTKNELMLACDSTGINPATDPDDFYSSPYQAITRKSYDDTYGNTDRMKMTVVGGSATFEERSNVLSWSGTTTYRFRMTWNGSQVRWWRGTPGQVLTEINPPSPMAVGTWSPQKLHIQLGATFRAGVRGVQESGGEPGTCYSLLRIYTQDLGNAATPGSGGTPVAPVIAEVTPDPDTASVGTAYTKQLSLTQGTTPVTWSVVSGPSGIQVSSSGYVSGWTPSATGTFTIVIRATNSAGSDDESWQVQAFSSPTATIATFPFTSDAQSWTLATWKAGQYELGTMIWDSASGNPGGNLKSTGSGSTNTNDNCTREGGLATRQISTAGYNNIQIEYDVIAALNTAPPSGCAGGCPTTILEGSCEDKLAVYYSTAGTSGPWTLVQELNEGDDLPASWTHKVISLASVSAANNNANFAVRFIWQFNTTADIGRIDNVTIKGSSLSTNQAPSVNAGPDQTITLPSGANLDGTVTDDGLPNPPATVTVSWTKQSGPGTVTFGNANAVDTTASFSTSGTYVLRLTASDSALSAYDEVTITVSPAPPGKATSPSPTNGATGVSISTTLSWTAGSGATSHKVYFGTTNPPAYKTEQSGTTYNPGTLANGTTYYWRIDEVNAGGTTTGDVWSFTTIVAAPGKATNPTPANGATGVSTSSTLSWTAGSGATSHKVHFGTVNPPPYLTTQATTTYNPGSLERSTTYYWRIDEVNTNGTTTGDVWSFVTIGIAGDFDSDGDVDLTDFGYLQRCYSGTDIPPTTGCENADLDGDNDVDQTDFEEFKNCLGGANRPPGC